MQERIRKSTTYDYKSDGTVDIKFVPPMALVRVTPMILERAVVVDSMPIIIVGSDDIMYVPIAPTLAAAIPPFKRFCAGSLTGSDLSSPKNS